MQEILQNTTCRVMLKAYASSDHLSAATSLTLPVVISKNGAAFGNPHAGTVNASEISSGWYYVDLDTNDTNTAGPLVVRATAASTDDVERTFVVVPATNRGMTALPNVAAGANGGLPTADASNQVKANVTAINGVAAAISDGTAQAGDSTHITLASSASAVANAYVDRTVTLVAGNGVGQSRIISAYDASSHVATVHRAWDSNPDSSSQYTIDPSAASNLVEWLGATPNALTTGKVDAVSALGTTSTGTVQSGAGNDSTHIILASTASAVANAYVDRTITLVAGTGIGQSRVISAFNAGTHVATVHRAWDSTPDSTTQYIIGQSAASNLVEWLGTAPAAYVSPPSQSTIATAVMGQAVDGSMTLAGLLRLFGAVLAGNLAISETQHEFSSPVDGQRVRINATVDGNGNRTVVSYDDAT